MYQEWNGKPPEITEAEKSAEPIQFPAVNEAEKKQQPAKPAAKPEQAQRKEPREEPSRFHTELFGFNRVEVLSYIEHISAANAEKARALEKTIAALQSGMANADDREKNIVQREQNVHRRETVLQKKAKQVLETLEVQKKRAEDAVAEADALRVEVNKANDEIAAVRSRLFAEEQENVTLRGKNENLTAKVDELTRSINQLHAQQKAAPPENHVNEKAVMQQVQLKARDILRAADEQASVHIERAKSRAEEIIADATMEKSQTRARLAESADEIAAGVAVLKQQLNAVDQRILSATESLQKATAGIVTALGNTERDLSALGAEVHRFSEAPASDFTAPKAPVYKAPSAQVPPVQQAPAYAPPAAPEFSAPQAPVYQTPVTPIRPVQEPPVREPRPYPYRAPEPEYRSAFGAQHRPLPGMEPRSETDREYSGQRRRPTAPPGAGFDAFMKMRQEEAEYYRQLQEQSRRQAQQYDDPDDSDYEYAFSQPDMRMKKPPAYRPYEREEYAPREWDRRPAYQMQESPVRAPQYPQERRQAPQMPDYGRRMREPEPPAYPQQPVSGYGKPHAPRPMPFAPFDPDGPHFGTYGQQPEAPRRRMPDYESDYIAQPVPLTPSADFASPYVKPSPSVILNAQNHGEENYQPDNPMIIPYSEPIPPTGKGTVRTQPRRPEPETTEEPDDILTNLKAMLDKESE